MKLSLLLLIIPMFGFSQKSRYIKLSEISVVTEKRDTLFLLDNHTGRIILESWDSYESKKDKDRPVILMVANLPPAQNRGTNYRVEGEK